MSDMFTSSPNCSRQSLAKMLGACVCLLALLLITSCTSAQKYFAQPDSDSMQSVLSSVVADSFEAKGQAGLERLDQDATQKFCSTQRNYKNPGSESISTQLMEKIRLENQSQISPPKDGNYFGDFKRGELLAQDGRGKTWSDPLGSPSGGNCYNCHQLSKNEVSYGTLGPSLYQYGKLRGIKDIDAFTDKAKQSTSDPIIQYTWGVLINAKAFNLCTVMPRFGVPLNAKVDSHSTAILTEQQIKDLMALLLDPRSPVND